MIVCGFCQHPGSHAEVVTSGGGPRYCSQCPTCQAERRRAESAQSNGTEPK